MADRANSWGQDALVYEHGEAGACTPSPAHVYPAAEAADNELARSRVDGLHACKARGPRHRVSGSAKSGAERRRIVKVGVGHPPRGIQIWFPERPIVIGIAANKISGIEKAEPGGPVRR